MKIVINENPSLSDTEVIINCKTTDENVLKILSILKSFDKKIMGIQNNSTFILEISDVFYFESVDKRTFIYTQNNVYETPLKLYELDEWLSALSFFRASKASIINIAKIKSITPQFGGKLEVVLLNNEKLEVSRQYAVILKTKLGMK